MPRRRDADEDRFPYNVPLWVFFLIAGLAMAMVLFWFERR